MGQRPGDAINWGIDQTGAELAKCPEKELKADPWGRVSVSRENPKGAQGYLVLTYLHPQPQSSSPVPPPPHNGPYLSWKPPQGAESSSSKGVRDQGPEAGT